MSITVKPSPLLRLGAGLAALVLASPLILRHAAAAAVEANPRVDAVLREIRERHHVPGLVGAIVQGDRLRAIGADGVRKVGAPEPITVNDQVHLGSCTKSMTATRIALLVDEGKLSWDTTLAKAFPNLAPEMHEDFRAVTLDQLLTHRAGLPANGPYSFLPGKTMPEQRLALAKILLKKAPESKPGTKNVYSNAGYILAGAMAEQATGQSWEDLMQKDLFGPLGMTTAGFGPPGTMGKVDEPWGHVNRFGLLIPAQADNPPVLGPAGRVHAALADWARFASFHFHGKAPSGLRLKPETLAHLHTPPPGENYACGWVVRTVPWGQEKALWHNGSNTMWYAEMWVVPGPDYAILTATNQFGDPGVKACDEAARALAELYLKGGLDD